MDATELARLLEQFFTDHPRAALLEDGRLMFEMATARYSVTAEHGRCVLHLWSEERNMVRTVVGLDSRKDTLRIRVRRLGTQRPQSLEVVRDRDHRTPAARALARTKYLGLLERLLIRYFNEYKIESLRSAMDLEHSFGPAYARGLLVHGQTCWALIAVNAAESQAIIDGILTLGILWLAYCREHRTATRFCQGLRVLVPAGCAGTTRARMAWLNRDLARWELYEVQEPSEELEADRHRRPGQPADALAAGLQSTSSPGTCATRSGPHPGPAALRHAGKGNRHCTQLDRGVASLIRT